jgi:hypothetical protein
MCTTADPFPGTAADALRMAGAGLDYLNSPPPVTCRPRRSVRSSRR